VFHGLCGAGDHDTPASPRVPHAGLAAPTTRLIKRGSNSSPGGGDTILEFSDGWLTGFKERHGIRSLKIAGETMSADVPAARKYVLEFSNKYKGVCHAILEPSPSGHASHGLLIGFADLDPELLYNADETGLYYRMLPDRTLASKRSEKGAKGHKACKKRLTVLVTCNSNGSDKHRLLVIGNSARPLCFRSKPGEPKPDPRVYWNHSKTAWMNRVIFRWWLRLFAADVKAFKRRTGKLHDALVSPTILAWTESPDCRAIC
jgi:hypothetical protein